ncbi:hypothetical protein [Bradyrhizobium sp. dw_411]|uniref:hypothetical protein n=1 Tax=Bradyrhizobium sp. dw_411 TaxID=2720082 RepID=UPI001BCE5FB8|nr:hypothetical protein [Bradyrhizobium sp. dw_411]
MKLDPVACACMPVARLPQNRRGGGLKIKRGFGGLLVGALFAASQFAAMPAHADEAQLQRQIDAMKRQLANMERELTQARKQPAQPRTASAPQAQGAVVTARNGNEIVIPAPAPPRPDDGATIFTKALPAWVDGIHFSLAGSFIALDSAVRQHSEVADGASSPPFGSPGIPLQNSALYNEREFRASAQQSRIAMKAWGDIDPNQHLKAYYEMDFLGASTDSNNRESNSFTPRIRQAFAEYDNDLWHFHFVVGQTWSLLAQERTGMLPNNENVPLTIDAQYVVGFDWLRNPQLRFVYDVNKVAWFGVSLEQPGAVFPGAPSAASVSPPAPIATSINNTCTGSSHLNGTTTCSNDIAPDVIEKFALDPGFGHYELLGVERWFSDQVANTTVPNSWSQKVTMGWGVGGNVLLPVIAKTLDLQGSVLYGQGIGRYTSSQLPDAVVGPDGSLTTVKMLSFMVGAVAHPFEGSDIYTYYGQDQSYANSWAVGGTQGGWGNPNFVNNGCLNQNLGGGTLGTFNTPIGGSTCTFDVQKAQEFTIGFWQDAYKGNWGRLRYGLQYEYVKLTAFPGVPGPVTATSTPNQGLTPNNNIVMLSVRYYPFN